METWFLCCRAEDRCRGEHFNRIRRNRLWKKKPTTWSDIFNEAATDDRFWDREVRRPALKFVASGCKGAPEDPDAEYDDVHGVKRKLGINDPKDGHGTVTKNPGSTKSSRKRQNKARQVTQLKAQLAQASQTRWGSGGEAQGKGQKGEGKKGQGKGKTKEPRMKYSQGRFVTDADGCEVCFPYHGKGCSLVCKFGRSHKCQYCLGGPPKHQLPQSCVKGAGTCGRVQALAGR